MRSSYYVEISMDDKDYERVIDHTSYLCRSWQKLHFPARVVRYIKEVVGRTILCLKNRNALINGNTQKLTTGTQATPAIRLVSGAICIQLAQPYILSTMRLLLWDCDDRSYSFYIEVSTDQLKWTQIVDKEQEACKQFAFDPLPVTFIRIVRTHNTANEVFHCVHFESPADSAVGNLINSSRCCQWAAKQSQAALGPACPISDMDRGPSISGSSSSTSSLSESHLNPVPALNYYGPNPQLHPQQQQGHFLQPSPPQGLADLQNLNYAGHMLQQQDVPEADRVDAS
ncbi:BTB/POZ domain-containing protein 9 [Bulinus truncatus]|nr:BTB/POZ domain-containing protein 9 [Bulinus truncatus]